MASRLSFARDHRLVPRLLSAYLEGDLAGSRRARVERHLAACPECHGALESLRQLLTQMRRVPPPADNPTPAEILDAVRARLHARGED